ncbi:hypothetical protein ACROYT_G028929 [Oculina patagonica]
MAAKLPEIQEPSLDPKQGECSNYSATSRKELRVQSTLLTEAGIVYRDSLQKCDLSANHCRLVALKEESERNKSFKKATKLKGLIECYANDHRTGNIKYREPSKRNKKNSWTEIRLKDLEEKKATKVERLAELRELAHPTTATSKQKVRQAVKRQASALQETHRLKRRRLGAGPERKLDSDDEEFLAKSIEEKATYHGRRHDTVMYKTKHNRKYCFAQSCDDKAYLRPGTSEGFEKTRNVKILTLASEGARQLPKYDWPEQMMYQTPSTHRILNKEGIEVNGQEKLVSVGDEHFVFIRPKQIVNSGGTTWANETHRLRCEFPDSFEVQSDTLISKEIRSFASTIQGDVYLFRDMSEKGDIEKVTDSLCCRYKEHEERRLNHLLCRIDKAEADFEASHGVTNGDTEAGNVEDIYQSLATLKEEATLLLNKYRESARVSWGDYTSILLKCTELLDLIKSMHLPPVKPRWAEFTDAGPGVGVSNFEVVFRDAELARIYSSDYRIRVHRAAGDSGQNEAERTNSAIGDAVVDGSTIDWEYYKRFDGLSEDEISSLSLQEYEEMEEERMRKNAWRVAIEVAARVDDAPVHSEYIKCFVSEKPDDGLFFNQELLKEFSSKGIEQKKEVPGASYMKKIY